MVIKINYTSSDVYVSTSVSPVYVVVNYSAVNNGGGAIWGGITGTISDQTDLQDALDDKVPYTGATGDVNLGEFELKAGQVEFDQTPTGTAGVGVMRWNDSDGTIDLGLKGGNVTLQVGQELVQRVVNKSGINLLESNYQVVRVSDAQGQRLAVQLAQGNNDANSTDTIGIVTETINDNQEGFVTTSGLVRNINTTGSLQGETWIDGDVLYLSPTVAGRITKVKPTAPNHSVILGYVVYAHANNGKIFVKVDNGYEIGELHDVYVPTPSNNDGIFWNSTNLRYENKTVAGALGYTPISGSGATGQVAYWNGTSSQTGSNNLFWNSANNRLGINTSTPTSTLHVVGTAYITENLRFDGQLRDNRDNGIIQQSLSSVVTNRILTIGNGTYLNINFPNGNILLGTTTDGGQRLQVQGDAFIKGSGNTSATTALTVQNSDGTVYLQLINDGRLQLGTASNNVQIFPFNTSQAPSLTSRNLMFYSPNGSQVASEGRFKFDGNGLTQTSGIVINIKSSSIFSPTSGTATYQELNVSPQINQTGGANGITRGLYVNPTLTAAADWRSIEWSNNSGWGLYGAGTANNFIGGTLIVGQNASFNSVNISRILSTSSASSVISNREIQSTVTSAVGFRSRLYTQTSTFAISDLSHFSAEAATVSGGATITNNYGFHATDELTTATNNYGFYGNIPNAANRWNLYMNGTADNYLRGKLLINTTTVSTFALDVNGTARVSGTITIGLGTNSGLRYDNSNRIYQDASFGWNIDSWDYTILTSISGSAYGGLLIRDATTGTKNTSAKLQIDSTTKGFLPPRMTTTQKNAIGTPAAGLIVYCTDSTEGLYQYINNAWVNLTGVVTNRQTASYTLALGDSNDLVEMNVATANNLTVPLNSSVAFPIGTKIDIAQYGAGQTTVVATSGVTVRSAGGALKLALQYSGASLVKIGTDEWYLFGDITV